MKKVVFFICCLSGFLLMLPAPLPAPLLPCIEVTKSCSDVVGTGEPIPFTGTVTNCSYWSLFNVTVVDDNGTPGDVSDDFTVFPPSTLASGQTATFSGTYSANVTPSTNTVTATGAYDSGATATDYASATCVTTQQAACWLTAGGVKFSPALDAYLDEYRPKSVLHSWGGNVNPACAPVKGHWNHIAHRAALHFQATDIQVIRCGNVAGIEPGSESPVTPVNFIEFTGPATLKGTNGNKVDYGAVCYFARAEDRNEPGSNGARDGSYIDRYFLHVYDCATQDTLLLVDTDANPGTQDPITITGGNMQMHFKPCDN